MASVDWSDRSLDNIARIVAYIEMFDADAAERTRKDIVALGNSLTDFPRRGRPGVDGTRELATLPPYIINYDVTGERVTILAVRHGRQRPPAGR